ncbi:MAG: ABC transporter permease [Firmicutes bacterium]|nr:ABC transporter permease [Bacillota bacterium]
MKSKLNYLINISLKRKIKTKWFLIANILIAVVIAGIINIDNIINVFGGDFNNQTKLYIIDETDLTYEIFKSELEETGSFLDDGGKMNYEIIKTDKTHDELKEILVNVKEEETSIVITFTHSEENVLDVSILTKSYIDLMDTQVLTSAINNTKTTIAIANSNISEDVLASIYNPVNIERIFLEEEKNSEDENMEMIMTTVFPIVILPFFMLTIFLVQMIGAEVNDEKTTRGMEIIISNVSPKTHFFAKVVAGNLFVIIQGLLLFLYAGVGIIIRNVIGGDSQTAGIITEIGSMASSVISSNIGSSLIYIVPLTLVLMLLTFVAYSLLAGILASMTTNTEDFQQLQTPIMIISLVGYYLAMMAGVFKGAIFIKVLSFVPFISAILSPSLMVLGQIGVIEIIISIILTIITIWILIKYGLRIYKVGILNYSAKDLWKKMFKALKK